MKKQRLDKFIANQLILSRSVVRNAIQKGKVKINGITVRDSGTIITESDNVTFEEKSVTYKEHIYVLMNKPMGILSASNDKSRKTVVDLVPSNLKRQGMFPVGRLDKDTTGLLIITDDGEFAHNCISPKKEISKSYIATLDGDITDNMIKTFADGVVLADGTLCKSAVLEKVGTNVARIIITEGKYHQIKRMFGTVGLGVNQLHRESIGNLTLPPELLQGECVEIDAETLKNSIFNN